MTQFQLLVVAALLGAVQVGGFSNNAAAGSRRVVGRGVLFDRSILTKAPLSSIPTFRLSTTSLRYRNSHHDPTVDPYAILGVPRNANEAEIKRAYRGMAKQFHPDVNPQFDTTHIFQQLNRAYEVLRNPQLKAHYDVFGLDGLGTSAASDPVPTTPGPPPRAPDHVYRASPSMSAGYDASYDAPYQAAAYHANHEHQQNQYQHQQHQRQQQQQKPNTSHGQSPFDESWDPWKPPFANTYNARMETEAPQQNMYDSFSVGQEVGFNAHQHQQQHQQQRSSYHGQRSSGPSKQSRQTMGERVDSTHTSAGTGTRGSTSRSYGQRQRWVGGDLSIDLEIDWITALEGGQEKIRIKHLAKCSPCTGNGIEPGAKVETCTHCGGTGAVIPKMEFSGISATNNYGKQEICHHCRGTGQKVAENCATCQGGGTSEESKEFTLTIPPGVGQGDKLRLKGEGDAGPMGGPSGDLFIFLTIKKEQAHQSYHHHHVRMP